MLVFFVVLSVVLAASNILYLRRVNQLKSDPQKVAQETTQELVEKVGKLIKLPEETPSVATVTDPEKLKAEQPFFTNAKAGDKVLIYTNARKAIMYSPEENKIVEVAPLVIGNPTPANNN